jgi:hypothetical protein
MPIGYDIDLLCDAVTFATEGYTINQRDLQRGIRVGFVKAQRLLLLMGDYGITTTPGSRQESRMVLLTKDQVPGKLAELREIASKEASDAV